MLYRFVKRSQLYFLLSFLVLIAAGTLLFKIPGVYSKGVLSWIDSLYMATSSVCVTGLAVVKVSDFSFWGQLIMLLLVQIGGLGIVTISAWLVLAMGKHFSFDEELMMSTLNDDFPARNAEVLIKLVISYTLVCEAVGAVVIFAGYLLKGIDWSIVNFFTTVWHSIFISVASYCNAGFSPYNDSVISLHWLSKFGSSIMILTGSLGVYIIYDVMQRISRKRFFMRAFTKLVLWATGVLLAIATILLFVLQNYVNHPIHLCDAYYMAVSGCSAGFNSVEMTNLSEVSLALIMFLMLVGGAPGSTAGGLKISTVAIAAAAIWNTIVGNRQIIVFKRSVPMDNVMKAFAVIALFGILVVLGSIAVKLTGNGQELGVLLFESVSAICTVGLSIGDTSANMGTEGKIVIAVLMYIGRIGPLTLLLFLLAREKPGKVEYPEERIIIG